MFMVRSSEYYFYSFLLQKKIWIKIRLKKSQDSPVYGDSPFNPGLSPTSLEERIGLEGWNAFVSTSCSCGFQIVLLAEFCRNYASEY
jgi:hypothetical protein